MNYEEKSIEFMSKNAIGVANMYTDKEELFKFENIIKKECLNFEFIKEDYMIYKSYKTTENELILTINDMSILLAKNFQININPQNIQSIIIMIDNQIINRIDSYSTYYYVLCENDCFQENYWKIPMEILITGILPALISLAKFEIKIILKKTFNINHINDLNIHKMIKYDIYDVKDKKLKNNFIMFSKDFLYDNTHYIQLNSLSDEDIYINYRDKYMFNWGGKIYKINVNHPVKKILIEKETFDESDLYLDFKFEYKYFTNQKINFLNERFKDDYIDTYNIYTTSKSPFEIKKCSCKVPFNTKIGNILIYDLKTYINFSMMENIYLVSKNPIQSIMFITAQNLRIMSGRAGVTYSK